MTQLILKRASASRSSLAVPCHRLEQHEQPERDGAYQPRAREHRSRAARIRTRRQGLCQTSTEHFQQRAEFLPLRNRGLGPLAVTVLPIPLARRAAATVCAAVQSTASLLVARLSPRTGVPMV